VTSQASIVTPAGPSAPSRRLVPKTLYPAVIKAAALARPIPDEAPVTIATPADFELI